MIGLIAALVSATLLDVVMLLALRTSRRAARWNEARVAAEVDRVVNAMIDGLGDGTHDDD